MVWDLFVLGGFWMMKFLLVCVRDIVRDWVVLLGMMGYWFLVGMGVVLVWFVLCGLIENIWLKLGSGLGVLSNVL